MRTIDDEDLIRQINITPLVDVVLVLLVVLMTAATATLREIPIQVPTAASSGMSPPTLSIVVHVESLSVDGQSPVDLRTYVHAAIAADPTTRAVVRADGDVAHARVVGVIDILRQEKIAAVAVDVRYGTARTSQTPELQ
ncbi:MAG: biopolymer transporter ExbD [Myxococcota bacterium]